MHRLLLCAALSWSSLTSCGDAAAPAEPTDGSVDAGGPRGLRYCELIAAVLDGGAVEAQVWGTQGLNDCPQGDWDAIDTAAVATELGAVMVLRNGPRYWVLDAIEADLDPGAERRTFGALEFRRIASVQVDPAAGNDPYTERVVDRTTVFTWRAGSEIYELLSPAGAIYVMQSYALIEDPTLRESDLPGLGARLTLPGGWDYRVRVLDADLNIRSTGDAVVIQDDLRNTYQRHTGG